MFFYHQFVFLIRLTNEKTFLSYSQVLNENNKGNGSGPSETVALSKHRSNGSLANSQSAASGPPAPTTSANPLSTIRTKNVIPSKDKSQQQHLSAASSNSPSNYSQKSRDEHSNRSTKEKHAKSSEFALFGTPIHAKSSKDGKSKKSGKSSGEKSGNSRCSTPTSTISNHQLAGKEYPDFKKERVGGKDVHKQLNKSTSSSGSTGPNRNLPAKPDKPNKIKKQLDLPISCKKSPSFASKHDEKRHHHSKGLKGSLSSSSSSLDSIEPVTKPIDFSKLPKIKKRKRSVSASSNEFDRSARSSRASSRSSSSSSDSYAASVRSDSNSSRASSVSSSVHRARSKKRDRDQYSPAKKKKNHQKDQSASNSKAKIKKEQPSNISSSRNMSSSQVPTRKGHKAKRKCKEEDETVGKKKSKTSESAGKEEERSGSSKKHKSSQSKNGKDLPPQEIIKEKNKDSINKQTSHKEHNLQKEATTSTKISFSNNNSTGLTTLEITSVKNVKMLQSESKKSKQHQDQSLNQSDKRSFKDKLPADSYPTSPLAKDDRRYDETPCSSPGYSDYRPSSSSKQTDDSRRKAAYENIMSDMRKNSEEISPLTSDSDSKMDYEEDDLYHSNDESALKRNFHNGLKEEPKGDQLQHEYVSELIVLQKQISELKDKEVLNDIVQIVRDSGSFSMNGTKFDFDLLKLDKTTVRKVKMCFP